MAESDQKVFPPEETTADHTMQVRPIPKKKLTLDNKHRQPLARAKYVGRVTLDMADAGQHWSLRYGLEGKVEIRRARCRSSGINDLWLCPRFFLFKNRLGLQRLGRFKGAMQVGTFFHTMCKSIYQGKDEAHALQAASVEATQRKEELVKMADDQGLLPNAKPLESSLDEMERAFSLAQAVFQASLPVFFASPILKGGDWDVLTVETAMEASFKHMPGIFRCMPDALLLKKATGELMIVNHKTTSHSPQMEAVRYGYAVQPRLERLIVQANFPDNPVKFYLHNVVRKPGFRFPTKECPTFDKYLEKVRKWYKDEHDKNPNDPPIMQSLVGFAGPQLDEELYMLLKEAALACNVMIDGNRFYRNPNSCFGRFGNSQCEYLELCKTDYGMWPDLIAKLYKQEFREDAENEEASE